MRKVEDFIWGKPCLHGHKIEDGTNLRHFKACVMCQEIKACEGMTQQEMFVYLTNPRPPKRTEEEKRAGQVAASMRWNKKNREKLSGYIKKYNAKPERKAICAARAKERYEAIPSEERSTKAAEKYQAMKLRDEARKEYNTPEAKAKRIEARRDRNNRVAREKYALLSKEEKKVLMAKQKEYKANVKQREQDESTT